MNRSAQRSAVFLAILMMAAAAPAVAAEKKAKKAAAQPVEQPLQQVDSNEASWRLVKGAFPIILPSWAMPIYMNVHGHQVDEGTKAKPAKQRKKAAQAPN